MRSRTTTAVVGILGSFLVSVVLWRYFGTAVFFLLVPFVPFLFRRSKRPRREDAVSECPTCGFRTTEDTYDYCPKDGTRLR